MVIRVGVYTRRFCTFSHNDEQQNRCEQRRVAKILRKYLDFSCNFTPYNGKIKENSCLCNRDEFRQKEPVFGGRFFYTPPVYECAQRDSLENMCAEVDKATDS